MYILYNIYDIYMYIHVWHNMYDRCGLNLRAAPGQGLERWKRQLTSVLRDGHALLTTLNEGVDHCGCIGCIASGLLETT